MAQLAVEPVALELAWVETSHHRGESPRATGLSSTKFNRQRMNTTSKATGGQFEDRGYCMEVIYSGCDKDVYSDEKTLLARIFSSTCEVMLFIYCINRACETSLLSCIS